LLAGLVAVLGVASLTASRADRVLAADPLDGSGTAAWRRAPSTFVEAPSGGRAFRCVRGATIDPATLPWIGDASWSAYRVEVDVLPEKNWAGIDFHVQEDGREGCEVTVIHVPENQIVFEIAGIWDGAYGWKLWPVGQRRIPHEDRRWVHVRLDVGATSANLYIDGSQEPAASFHDLPFAHGGVRLATYAGSALFRNLRIVEIAERDARARLEDPWAAVRKGHVLAEWAVTPPREKDYSADRLPPEVLSDTGPWTRAVADARGVINLSALFRGRNTAGVTFAKTTLTATKAGPRQVKLTYTDSYSLWCNGEKVFTGPPRQWFHPEREKHGNSRLIPDQYEVTLPLRAGANQVVVRSEVTEPFGWAFWMRLVDE
jgi:hypothetical protein